MSLREKAELKPKNTFLASCFTECLLKKSFVSFFVSKFGSDLLHDLKVRTMDFLNKGKWNSRVFVRVVTNSIRDSYFVNFV